MRPIDFTRNGTKEMRQAAKHLRCAAAHFGAAGKGYHARSSQRLCNELLAVAKKIEEEDPEEIRQAEQAIFEEVMKDLPPRRGDS
jgi:hypothetical protein